MLTVALLRAMGMEADPALVNTAQQRGIESWLPSPGAFNHVVVRARLDGRDLWLDPTRSLQEGSLATLAQADYGPALVVNERTDRLVPMAGEQARRHAREVRAVFDSREGLDKPVKYTVSSVARGAAADALRATLASQSREQLQKLYVNFYANYFAGVAVAAPLEVADDAAANAVTLTEHYVIDKFWQRSETQKRLVAAIDAPELFDYLRRPRAQVRNSPLSLAHPTDLKHVTEVRLPASWSVKPDTTRIEDPAFEFQREERWIEERTLVLTDHFKSRLDHVAAADVGRYAASIEKARKAVNYELYWNDTPVRTAVQPAPHWVPAVVGVLAMLGCLALAWRVYLWDPRPWDALPPAYPVPPSGLGGWLLLTGLDLMLAGLIPQAAQSVSAKDWGGLFRQGLSAALWTSYFLRSTRVRATFVERRRGRASEPASPQWHPVFAGALGFIRRHLAPPG